MAEFNKINYQNKVRDEKYERFEILAPKGTKEKAAAAAERRGLFNKRGLPNVSEYVLQLIEEDLILHDPEAREKYVEELEKKGKEYLEKADIKTISANVNLPEKPENEPEIKMGK